MTKNGLFKLGIIIIFVVINAFIWFRVSGSGRSDALKVVFLDVGQGDAIFIETSLGNQVLIDGGAGEKALRSLGRVMSPFDRSIDVVLATHPDSDHIGGLAEVLRRFDVAFYVESGNKSDTLVYQSLEEALSEEKANRILAEKGQIIDLGQGVYLEILFPDRDVSGIEPNAASIIAKANLGNVSFLLTGDAPSSIERYLAGVYGKDLESEVLKVGHHGSKTSSDKAFLSFVSPEYAVISAGENNKYGHPHEEVIEKLRDFKIEILETAKEGNITFVSNGGEVKLK